MGTLYQQAVNYLNEAIDSDPRDVLAFINRGFVWETLGDLDKAFADYSRAIELNPGNPTAYINRGNVYLKRADYLNAAIDETVAIQLDTRRCDPIAYFYRGQAYRGLQRWNEALGDYQTYFITEDAQGRYVRAARAYAFAIAVLIKEPQAPIETPAEGPQQTDTNRALPIDALQLAEIDLPMPIVPPSPAPMDLPALPIDAPQLAEIHLPAPIVLPSPAPMDLPALPSDAPQLTEIDLPAPIIPPSPAPTDLPPLPINAPQLAEIHLPTPAPTAAAQLTNTPTTIASLIQSFKRAKSKGLSLRANFSWTLVGNVLYAGTQALMLVVLTKAFTPDEFGTYALAMGIATPIASFSALQLRAVMVSARDEKTSFAVFLVARLLTSILAFVTIGMVCLVGIVSPSIAPILLVTGFGQSVVSIKDIFQGSMQRQEHMDTVAFSLILQGISTIILVGLLTRLTHNIVFAVLGMGIAELIILIVYDVPVAARLKSGLSMLLPWGEIQAAFDLSKILSLTKLALPLGIVTLLAALQVSIPRYFLANRADNSAVGFFTAVSTFMVIEELVISALGQSTIRRLSVYHDTDLKQYRRFLLRLTLLGVGFGVLGVAGFAVIGREAIVILFRKEYAGYYDVLLWLMVARIVLNAANFMGIGMTAARRFRPQLWQSGLMTGTLFIASAALIPQWSGTGAAWAILASSVVGFLGGAVVLRRELLGKPALAPV